MYQNKAIVCLRKCPQCNKELKYSNRSTFVKAVKTNTLCKTCTGLNRFSPDDLTGLKVGKLTVIRRVIPSPLSHTSAWLCRCDCGSPERIVSGTKLKSGKIFGCGCWRPSQRLFNDKEKHCNRCKKWLPLDNFGKNRSTSSGRTDYCKSCIKEAYYGGLSSTEYNRQRAFKISPEDYSIMLTKQDSQCAICRRKKPLCVDHNHKTGFVRGLLCKYCNVMLGVLNDDVTALERAIQYLKNEFVAQV